MLDKNPAIRPSAAEVDAPRLPARRTFRTRISVLKPVPLDSQGRTEERAALRAALTTTAAGSGQMVCLVGESGIGKTTLVDDFLADFQPVGVGPTLPAGGAPND